MKAVLVKAPGGVDQLYIGEAPIPDLGELDVLVRVSTSALNRADTMQRKGMYPPPPGASPILGLEAAGVVERVGARVTDFAPGDRVCALLPGGGYAQYVSVPSGMAMRIPEGVGMDVAAGFPEAFLTAYQAVVWLGKLERGGSILIHAGASGVGTAAIQLARVLGAKHIIATAGSQDKLDLCTSLGATTVVNYKTSNFAEVVKATTRDGVNVVVDFVGASYWAQNIDAMAVDGRMVMLSFLGGTSVENMLLQPFLAKRLTVMGSTLRARSLEYKVELTRALADLALPLLADGTVRVVIDSTFPATSVADAHARMEANANSGKIVLDGFAGL